MTMDPHYAQSAKNHTPLLLCNLSFEENEPLSRTVIMAHDPMDCFDLAVSAEPETIVVQFSEEPRRKWDILKNLCVALKRNPYTCPSVLVTWLPSPHRLLLQGLHQAGVDFVKIGGEDLLNFEGLLKGLKELGPKDRIPAHLDRLCPFLDYLVDDSGTEVTVCGAHADRMVLGGARLHEMCETQKHLTCAFYRDSERES